MTLLINELFAGHHSLSKCLLIMLDNKEFATKVKAHVLDLNQLNVLRIISARQNFALFPCTL